MLKKWIVLLLLLALAVIVQAQDATEEATPEATAEPVMQEETPEATAAPDMAQLREIYVALAYGEEVFEPGVWQASATEMELQTTAQWNAPSLGALSFLNYLHFKDGITLDGMNEFFDKTWFDATFANYESYRKTGVCYADEVTLHKFTLGLRGSDYAMRYWTELVGPTRIAAIYIVVPSNTPEAMDQYAARLFPELPDCKAT